uniref:SLC2A4 regulator n=1 Tax=Chrysolophus pictus TaxID=9089 RepID=A0A8C3LTZ4_CHRPC
MALQHPPGTGDPGGHPRPMRSLPQLPAGPRPPLSPAMRPSMTEPGRHVALSRTMRLWIFTGRRQQNGTGRGSPPSRTTSMRVLVICGEGNLGEVLAGPVPMGCRCTSPTYSNPNTGRWMNGWMDGWTDGWMDGWRLGTAALPRKALPGARGWLRRLGEPLGLQPPEQEAVLRVLDVGLERCLALHAACIPLPGHRKLPGKAGIDEVMAAAVLTSLSSSPLGLGHPPAPPGPAELGSEIWKETPAVSFSCSSSSNTSGEWSWDPPSDRSTPSTPSPPLSSHDPSAFLPTLPPDDGPEEPDSTHFMFGEPIPRKRKNSTKVMFKCLWKSCGKVLSSSSGMQKHIRTAHLGRQADLEQSDGEEDFYYTELDVDVDSLTDGLSSLTPVSPTSSVPPAFPGPELPPFPSPEPPLGSPRSPPPPPGLCHVHTDHAYQGCPSGPTAGEKRPPGPPVPGLRMPALPTPTLPKPPAVPRKPRGEAKKCRKVYGMENRELWCTACRWKKACQRFLD